MRADEVIMPSPGWLKSGDLPCQILPWSECFRISLVWAVLASRCSLPLHWLQTVVPRQLRHCCFSRHYNLLHFVGPAASQSLLSISVWNCLFVVTFKMKSYWIPLKYQTILLSLFHVRRSAVSQAPKWNSLHFMSYAFILPLRIRYQLFVERKRAFSQECVSMHVF